MTDFTKSPEAYFELSSSSKKRELHPLAVLARQGNSWTVRCLEPGLMIDEESDIRIYYDLHRQFMQQPARVRVIRDDEESDTVEFEIKLQGKPVSAESRQCFRVVTVLADRWMKFGEEDRCQIVDISATGCAVISRQDLKGSQTIGASIEYRDKTYQGTLCVQSKSVLSSGRIRYGLHCTDGKKQDSNLLMALQIISMEIQREQLRRLAGAA